MQTADTLVELIRTLIRDELRKQDSTELCRIVSANEVNNTVTISLYSDLKTEIPNIINASKYTFQSGDIGVLFKIGGQLNNAFIIAKVSPDL